MTFLRAFLCRRELPTRRGQVGRKGHGRGLCRAHAVIPSKTKTRLQEKMVSGMEELFPLQIAQFV